MNKTKFLMAALAVAAAATLTTGCGGGGAKVQASTTTTTTTMGQELMDLDAAYQKGIINEEQYNASKKQILKRYKK
jgi:ABC-type glycerol-3-phosphate transport system substrate-binding protein